MHKEFLWSTCLQFFQSKSKSIILGMMTYLETQEVGSSGQQRVESQANSLMDVEVHGCNGAKSSFHTHNRCQFHSSSSQCFNGKLHKYEFHELKIILHGIFVSTLLKENICRQTGVINEYSINHLGHWMKNSNVQMIHHISISLLL